MRSKLLFLFVLLSLLASAQFNPGKYWPVGFVQASDEDAGSELVYSITAGNTGGYFVVMPCQGIVKVDTAAYATFTLQRTWNLTIKVTDMEGNYIKTTGKVVLKKVKGIKVKPTVAGL